MKAIDSRARTRDQDPHRSARSPRGFTLLEILLAIGVLSLLLALTLPTLGRVSRTADRAKTLAWFADWGAAMELFHQEYGYFPDLTAADGSSGRIDGSRFVAALTGRDRDGDPVPPAAAAGNVRGLRFLSLPAAALDSAHGELLDAFGNCDVVVLVDADNDGRIRGDELVRLDLRRGCSGSGFMAAGQPPASSFPVEGLRANVAFYSAGAGDWIFSWQ